MGVPDVAVVVYLWHVSGPALAALLALLFVVALVQAASLAPHA